MFLKGGFGKGFLGGNKVKEEVDPGAVEGTDLRILKYPHPKLRTDNENIDKFDDEIKDIALQMLKVMYAADGIGLAAPQVGINKKLMGVIIDTNEISVSKSINSTNNENLIIGELRSGGYSPHFKKVIGIAMLNKPYYEVSQKFH